MQKKRRKRSGPSMAAVQLAAIRELSQRLSASEAAEEQAKKDLRAARGGVHKALKGLRELIATDNPLFDRGEAPADGDTA